jgi:hypothetical protein
MALTGLDELPGSRMCTTPTAITHRIPLQERPFAAKSSIRGSVGGAAGAAPADPEAVDGVLVVECQFIWNPGEGEAMAGSLRFPLYGDEGGARGSQVHVMKTTSYTRGLSNLADETPVHHHQQVGRSGASSALSYNSSSLPRASPNDPQHLQNQHPYDNVDSRAAVDRSLASTPSHHSSHQVIQHQQQFYKQKGVVDRLLKKPAEEEGRLVGVDGTGRVVSVSPEEEAVQRKASAERRERLWRANAVGDGHGDMTKGSFTSLFLSRPCPRESYGYA